MTSAYFAAYLLGVVSLLFAGCCGMTATGPTAESTELSANNCDLSSTCDMVSSPAIKETCIFDAGKGRTGNKACCLKLEDLEQKEKCIYGGTEYGLQGIKQDVCQYLNNVSKRDDCYMQYAKYVSQKGCSEIQAQQQKDYCYANWGTWSKKSGSSPV